MSFLTPRIRSIQFKTLPKRHKLRIFCGTWFPNVIFAILYILNYISAWGMAYDIYRLDLVELYKDEDTKNWRFALVVCLMWILMICWIHAVVFGSWIAFMVDLIYETGLDIRDRAKRKKDGDGFSLPKSNDRMIPDHALFGVAQSVNPLMKLFCCGCYTLVELDRMYKRQNQGVTQVVIPLMRILNSVVEDGIKIAIGFMILRISDAVIFGYAGIVLSIMMLVAYIVWQIFVWICMVILYGCLKDNHGNFRDSSLHNANVNRNVAPRNAENLEHLFILIHGNQGFPQQMYKMRNQLVMNFGMNIACFVPECNSKDTFHGVDEGGRRIAEEFNDFINEFTVPPKYKVKLSIIAHSLGGLYARSFLEHIQVKYPEKWEMFTPTSFLTCNSPHLGVRKPLKGMRTYFRSVGADMYSELIGETGDDLFLRSDCLAKLSDPEGMSMKGLKAFRFRTVMGVKTDWVVPLPSAIVSDFSPFPHVNSLRELFKQTGRIIDVENYSNFEPIYTEKVFETQSFPCKSGNIPDFAQEGKSRFVCDNNHSIEFERQTLKNLQTLSWRRLCVDFYLYRKSLIVNGTMHGLSFGIAGKLSWMPFLASNSSTGDLFMEFLSRILFLDHNPPIENVTPVTFPAGSEKLGDVESSNDADAVELKDIDSSKEEIAESTDVVSEKKIAPTNILVVAETKESTNLPSAEENEGNEKNENDSTDASSEKESSDVSSQGKESSESEEPIDVPSTEQKKEDDVPQEFVSSGNPELDRIRLNHLKKAKTMQ